MLKQYLNVHHDRVLLHTFQFIMQLPSFWTLCHLAYWQNKNKLRGP
jgi:hypothetical protein